MLVDPISAPFDAGHDNKITYDGVDATGISNQPQKTGIRFAIPTSAIAEFKVDSALYNAASADRAGGQVVLASVGGKKAFHGEASDSVGKANGRFNIRGA